MRSSIVAALALVATIVAIPFARAAEGFEAVPGRILIVRTEKLAKFVAKPPTGMTFDLPDATNDPTTEGGSLEFFDPDVYPSAYFELPSSGWKGLGNPAGENGYKYRGSPFDPCPVVLVKERILKAVCKGTGVRLPTPFPGEVTIVLTVGDGFNDRKLYCAVFGGDEVRNDSALLKRKNAPAAPDCLSISEGTTTTSTVSAGPSTTSPTTTTSTTVP